MNCIADASERSTRSPYLTQSRRDKTRMVPLRGRTRLRSATAARVLKRRAHVALMGFESVDLTVGGSLVFKSVGCCREGMPDACDRPASKRCYRNLLQPSRTAGVCWGRVTGREVGEHAIVCLVCQPILGLDHLGEHQAYPHRCER